MIKIFSKEQCKYCHLAKAFMKEHGIPFEEVQLDPEAADYAERRQALIDSTQHKTFPWVFVKESFVGGYDDLVHAFNTGSLHTQLRELGVEIDEPDF